VPCSGGVARRRAGSAHQAIIQLAVQVEDTPRDGGGVLVGRPKQCRDDGSLAAPRRLERQVILHPSKDAAQLYQLKVLRTVSPVGRERLQFRGRCALAREVC
jgi:hypothetical protein